MPEKISDTTMRKKQFLKNRRPKLPLLIALTVIAVAAVWGASLLLGDSGSNPAALFFGEPVTESRSYIGRTVSMTHIEPLIEAGRVSIPLELLETHEMVYFEVANNESFSVPLMAYITPSGRIFAGSSMCEPCQGRSFFLAGETLVCETCRTTYTIESHQFLSGSQDCGRYPPVYMEPVVENGTVSINLAVIQQWRIRTYQGG